ncbi:MarR family winged helix-turn-helix transcriptional regulator [Subtercola lobariae]|uniref:Transcriptional regulator, MarR family protein n=1 Tax=Subtercola lobariae TaxID=1588641 RepID=A0A917EWE7_9MICO|nr:MarR family transcriptional regulator [Subtercola lobariae]GGF21589.1 putative transcriptional regulator, MarR family protein [Subtercola lobariae]
MDPSTHYASGYLLTKIGQLTSARFAERLETLGIRPKHFGLLLAVNSMPPGPQTALGQALGVVPSAIVTMLDDLEERNAVARVADPTSRRSFVIELTAVGRELLNDAARLGDEVDAELLGSLDMDARAALQRTLERVATQNGLIAAAK